MSINISYFLILLYSAPTLTDCKGKNWQKGPGKLCFQINHVSKTWEGKRLHLVLMFSMQHLFSPSFLF